MKWPEYAVPTLIVVIVNGNKSSRVRPYGEGRLIVTGGGRRSEGDRESSSTEQAVLESQGYRLLSLLCALVKGSMTL